MNMAGTSHEGEDAIMKKIFVSFILMMCCLMIGLSLPSFAQSPFAYPQQPPIYYQPYSPPQQGYIQPGMIPSYPYSPPQSPPQWSGSGYYQYSPKQLYQCGLNLVYAKRYYEAVQVFFQFLRRYPQSSLADNALYWTGESYYAQKQYRTALMYFQQVQIRYPRGNKVPDALLKTALSYISMKQQYRGCQALNDLISRYPNSEPARKAYRWLGRCGWYSPSPSPDCGGYGYPAPSPSPDCGYGYPGYNDSTFPKNY